MSPDAMKTDTAAAIRDHLRRALELANLTHPHADERGTFGLIRRALEAVEGGDTFKQWSRNGEWPNGRPGPLRAAANCAQLDAASIEVIAGALETARRNWRCSKDTEPTPVVVCTSDGVYFETTPDASGLFECWHDGGRIHPNQYYPDISAQDIYAAQLDIRAERDAEHAAAFADMAELDHEYNS